MLQLPEVVAAKDRFGSSDIVQFTIALTDGIRAALQSRFGLDLSTVSEIPMRWIKGDTAAHVDRGSRSFENTYLVYLQDSEGEFILGTDSYPITANTGFVFEEGTIHKTENTGTEPRLLIGPMNEFAGPVGGATINYYPTLNDANNDTNMYVVGYSGLIQTVGGFSSWSVARVINNETLNPETPPPGIYSTGYTISSFPGYNTGFTYYLYPNAICFKEGTQILCLKDGVETYVPIETMCAGTLVKTSRDGYKKVEIIGNRIISNAGDKERIEARLYKLSPSNYPELKEDLFITGGHSILVDNITDKQREEITAHLGNIYVTDKKYRLTAMVDERAEPWASEGNYTVWHFALEHEDIKMNYGVYANGGLLVESCSINTMRTKSNLTLV